MFIKVFMFIKIFFIFLYHIDANVEEPLINGVIVSIIFIFVNVLVQYSIKISEDIVKLNVNLKTIEEDERIRTSLFKITHEIKNPIAVCKSYLDMFDFNNPDHERYIPILKDEMKKILILLQDFSSMNKIKIINEILDINLLLDDVKRQLETFVISDNIRFITELNDEEFYLEGDYNRISQVLTNIIKNAKEAKDESKEAYIILKTKIKNDVFKIIVEDNGIGISEEDMKRIKEPFFTTKKNGTGLGIPLSCEIIKAHGGKIEFQSEEGEGTKVIISLPVKNFEF